MFLKTVMLFLCYVATAPHTHRRHSHCSHYHTQRPHRGVHEVVSCVFIASLSSLPFLRLSPNYFFLTCHNFLTMRLLASAATVLKTITYITTLRQPRTHTTRLVASHYRRLQAAYPGIAQLFSIMHSHIMRTGHKDPLSSICVLMHAQTYV